VSYGIYFVRRDPGQSFEDALEVVEDSYVKELGPLTSVELEQWDRLLPRARAILGEVQESGDDTARELVHEPSGIELSLLRDQVSLTVPYGHSGDDAVEVMGQVYALARAVEDETGLEGYDPQLGEPVSASRESAADSGFTRPSADDPSHQPSRGGAAQDSGSAAQDNGPEPTAAPRPRRRWWEFWK
jgi:hypothetical protein